VKQQAYIEIAEQSFAHLHTLSLQWHLKKKMGNVVRSMDRGTDAANNLITYLFLYLVPAIAECIATVGGVPGRCGQQQCSWGVAFGVGVCCCCGVAFSLLCGCCRCRCRGRCR